MAHDTLFIVEISDEGGGGGGGGGAGGRGGGGGGEGEGKEYEEAGQLLLGGCGAARACVSQSSVERISRAQERQRIV